MGQDNNNCLCPFGHLQQNPIDEGANKQQTFVFHSSEGWKSEIRKPAWLVSAVFQVTDFQLCPHMGGGKGISLGSLL